MSEAVDTALNFLKESGFLFLAMFIGTVSYRTLTNTYRLIFFQTIAAIISFFAAYAVLDYQQSHQQPLNNHWVYNLYIFVEVLLLLDAAWMSFSPSRRKLITMAIAGFVLIYVAEVIFDGFSSLLNMTLVASGILIVITYLQVLYSAIHRPGFNWKTSPEFWLSLGVVIYFACNVPVIGLMPVLMKDHATLLGNLFYITEYLAVVRYLFVCVALYLARRSLATTSR